MSVLSVRKKTCSLLFIPCCFSARRPCCFALLHCCIEEPILILSGQNFLSCVYCQTPWFLINRIPTHVPRNVTIWLAKISHKDRPSAVPTSWWRRCLYCFRPDRARGLSGSDRKWLLPFVRAVGETDKLQLGSDLRFSIYCRWGRSLTRQPLPSPCLFSCLPACLSPLRSPGVHAMLKGAGADPLFSTPFLIPAPSEGPLGNLPERQIVCAYLCKYPS